MCSLACKTCDIKILPKAVVYCKQCNLLQCIECEKQTHKSLHHNKHERFDLTQIDNEYCSIDRNHPAVFYCVTCSLLFCYRCYTQKHQEMNSKEHQIQKFLSRSGITTFESIKMDDNDDQCASVSDSARHYHREKRSANTLSQQNPSHNQYSTDPSSDDVFLLLNANEHLTVNNESDFIRQFQCSQQDPKVKCVSIIGNTGDGKSYTLNQVFFNGQQKFHTSSTTESCTMGVWAALDENQRTLILDTEGRLGLSQNDNIRNRLLLKILCVSDIIIYRTRAPKLPNDMFQFLSDASNAFIKFFRKELENLMKNCKVDGPMSTMGPTLIVFHETQYTEVLRDHFQCQKTAVEQLKERFEKMNLSYNAYSSIEYVGTQTVGEKATDFSEIKATITATLENNKIRSPRRLSVIFKALKALNEKFNHAIPPEVASTLPDEFFTCNIACLSCGIKCTLAANHQKEDIPHHCDKPCSYNKEIDNEIWKCLQCNRDGVENIVYGKIITKDDGLLQGLLKYLWSGFVIECPKHGEIYRSRKYWYGNNEPTDVTCVKIIHVWPGEDNSRAYSDVTARKVVQVIRNTSSPLATPTKVIGEMMTDQIAPSYWVANKDARECLSCKLVFGSDYAKHHCRACGHIFCDACTPHRAIVPLLDIKTPERVCDHCYNKLQHEYNQASSLRDSTEYHVPVSRRFLDLVKNNIGSVVYDYSIKYIQESTRPSYWRPDSECLCCFICKHPFNTTTHRIHHCRKCGEGVCDTCSPNRRTVPEREWYTSERVCKSCETIMDQMKSE